MIAIVSLVIFGLTFFFILTERIHRTVIGFFGAIAMLLFGIFFDFYHPHEALAAIDFNTIVVTDTVGRPNSMVKPASPSATR